MTARPQISWALAALAASTLLPSAARADEGARIALRWIAPAECPSGDAVRAEVDRLLGPTASRPPAPIAVSADVTRDERGAWHVHVETPGEGTTRVREIHGASCAAIADATALIFALMIDPAAALAAPIARPLEGATRPTEGATRPTEGATRPPRSVMASPRTLSRPTPTSLRVAAWAGVDTASLSRPAATLALRGSLVYGAQRFELGMVVLPARSTTLASRPTTGGDIDLVAGSAGTCRNFGRGAIEAGPCLGVEFGRLHAVGFGVSAPGAGASLWAGLEGGGLISYRLGASVALGMRLGAVVPLLRPRFVLDHVGPVFQPPALAARGSAGVEVSF